MDTKEIIRERLHAIEKKHDVRVLLAVESGSRAWGFASPDSDYDVRFIYIHRPEWYLSLKEGRDVIEELDPDGVLDFAGWDLKKALLLMSKCNSMFVEWLSSPIYYVREYDFFNEIYHLKDLYFRRTYCVHHYFHMAVHHDERYLEKRGCELKRFMYYLRGLLAAKWAFEHDTYPPVPFMDLVDDEISDELIKTGIRELVRLKSESKEHDMSLVDEKLVEYTNALKEEVEKTLVDLPHQELPDIAPLDEFFMKTLQYTTFAERAYLNEFHKRHEESSMASQAESFRTPITYEQALLQTKNIHGKGFAAIFAGIQGSGKTTFFKERFEPLGFTHISMDELHNRNKEEQLIRECIAQGRSFVIDNTNPTKAERKRYMDMLRGTNYETLCYFFQSRVKDCIERNHLRGMTVPDNAIAATSNKLELPSSDEGFWNMIFVKVIPPHFETSTYKEDKK